MRPSVSTAQPLPFTPHSGLRSAAGLWRAGGWLSMGAPPGRGRGWALELNTPSSQGLGMRDSEGSSFLGPGGPWQSSHQRRDSRLLISCLRPCKGATCPSTTRPLRIAVHWGGGRGERWTCDSRYRPPPSMVLAEKGSGRERSAAWGGVQPTVAPRPGHLPTNLLGLAGPWLPHPKGPLTNLCPRSAF